MKEKRKRKQILKRSLIALMAIALVFPMMITGCGDGGGRGGGGDGDGPTPIRFFRVAVTQNPETDRVLIELQERTNTVIEFVTAPWDQEATRVATILASGEEIDIISFAPAGFIEYSRNGVFIQLDEKLQGDRERWFNLYTLAYSDLFSHVLVDGNVHGIPMPVQPGGGWIAGIRRDWLDNVGLDVPRTHEDLYDVFYAFRNNDPTGTGRETFAMTVAQIFNSWWFLVNTHSRPIGWNVDADGNLYRVETGPGRREAYRFMKRLFDDGLMNRDVITIRDRDLDINDFIVGNTGIAFSPMWAKTLEDVRSNHPEAEIELLFPIPHNPEFTDGASTSTAGWQWMTSVFPATGNNPERAMDLLEYLHSPSGRKLMSVGIEGIHYEREENSVFFGINLEEQGRDWDPADGEGPTGHPLWWGLSSTINGIIDFRTYEHDLLAGLQNASTFVMYEDLVRNPFWDQRKLLTTLSAEEQVPIWLESGSEHGGRLQGIRQEFEARMLLESADDFDAIWDEYVATMMANGLAEMYEEALAWWTANR